MRRRKKVGLQGAAAVLAAAALFLAISVTGNPSDGDSAPILLSDLQYELVSGSLETDRTYEINVRVESGSESPQSAEIGFFYTEQRTRRHNLIGIATAFLLSRGDWVLSSIRWNTAGLNPGLYGLQAVVLGTPEIVVEGEDSVAVILADTGLVWPPQEVRLELAEEVLCSMDWDRLDGYPTPRATLFDIWNVGSRPITATDSGASQLLVRGVVTLLDEEAAAASTSVFDLSGTPALVVLSPSPLAAGAAAPSTAFVRVDLNRFVREAITLYVEQQQDVDEVTLRLGSPIPIRTALEFTTDDISQKPLARSLQSFRAFLPSTTDPQATSSAWFSLYTDVEDFIFPRHETCSTSPETPGNLSPSVLPVASLEHAAAWNTYVVVETSSGGDEIYLLSRRGQYGGIYGSPIPVLARNDAGIPTTMAAKITARPVVGVGADPAAGFSRKPVLFFCGDDGFLRAYMDLGNTFSRVWNPDGWSSNAVRVPTGSDKALSPPAVIPRVQPERFSFQQDATEYVVVGSSEGLYVYRLEYGGTTGQALFRSYTGYNVMTEFPPFVVKRGTRRLVYFFARRDTETTTRLWAVDVSTTALPTSVVLLLGGDTPSTEIVAAKDGDLAEDLTYLFFGTRDGKVYAVNTTSGTVGMPEAERTLGNRILGVRAVASTESTGYEVYANTEGNRLFRIPAAVVGTTLQLSTEEAFNPPYSNEYIMASALEVMPGRGDRPGMLFLTYEAGPVVGLDLENPNQLLVIDVWENVWTSTVPRPTELTP
ncbi:MAG TPA: hypothetical protein ENN96_01630, partial [Candidatus Acetothermia bacterium]|nr:hypothetical protein [Candidatus Acetothermia bacterium]